MDRIGKFFHFIFVADKTCFNKHSGAGGIHQNAITGKFYSAVNSIDCRNQMRLQKIIEIYVCCIKFVAGQGRGGREVSLYALLCLLFTIFLDYFHESHIKCI